MTALRRRRLLPVFALLALFPFPLPVFAHRLDEYLQATLVAIEPGSIRLQINLTPGAAVAEQILSRVDRDHDGLISAKEANTYAEWLQRDLIVQLDRHNVELKLSASSFPDLAELRTGFGIIQLEFSLVSGPFTSGLHRLTLENRHLPNVGAYLFNAAKPKSESIQIGAQKRNEIQSTGEIEFTFDPPARAR